MLLGVTIETWKHVLWTLLLSTVPLVLFFFLALSEWDTAMSRKRAKRERFWDGVCVILFFLIGAVAVAALAIALALTTYAIWN